jgi:hypothetical protein
MTGPAKQSIAPHTETWIASSLALLAMTIGTLFENSNQMAKRPLASHLPLRILGLAMPLLLPRLPVGCVAAIEAARRSAKHAVVTGEMSGGTSDDGALDAAFGIGGGGRRECQRSDGERSKEDSHDHVSR